MFLQCFFLHHDILQKYKNINKNTANIRDSSKTPISFFNNEKFAN